MLSNKQRTSIFVTLMMGTFIVSMTTTVTANMLPAIMRDLNIVTSTAQWLTSGATLVSGIMIPITAYLMKRFPSRNYFLAAMIIFCIGAFLGAIAPSFPILLAGRLIQAMGCGMLMPFAQVVLMAIYPVEKHGSVISIYALGSTFAPVVAPTIAGFVIDAFGWQAMFTILFVVGLIILVLGIIFMRNVTENFAERFHPLPVILSSIGFSGLLIGLGNLSRNSIISMETGGALLAGLISLILFVVMQLRAEAPLLNLRIFRYPMFRISVIMSILMYIICMGSGTLLPIFTQTVLGYSATTYALATLPGSAVMAIVTVTAGRIYDKSGPRLLLIGGVTMLLAGSILGVMFHKDASLIHIGIVSCLLSAGTGFLSSPTTTMGLSKLDAKSRVDGSSILNTLRQIASSLASTLAILIYSLLSKYAGDVIGVKAAYTFYIGISVITIIFALRFLQSSKKSK